MVYVCHIFPHQSISDGHLGWFQVFAIVNSAAVIIGVHDILKNVARIFYNVTTETDFEK